MLHPEPYRVHERPPTVEELRALYAAVGWTDLPDDDAVARGLSASLFGVVVTLGPDLAGCGRVVGDGGVYFYVQDLIVAPAHQGRGVGDIVMRELLRRLERQATRNAFVGLMAADGRAGFYERYGFAARPPGSPGMALAWDAGRTPAAPRRPGPPASDR